MLKIYCPECGSPTEYSLNKPKFCTNCGNSFLGVKKEKVALPVQMQKPTLSKAKRPNIEPEDYEDDYTEITEVNKIPDIDSLSFDINIQPSSTEKIGDIIGSSSDKENQLRKNKEKIKINKKDLLDSLKKEGSAIKPKSFSRRKK
jgi:uncharacterized Zn finger protein (UPF0148 family)